MLSNVLGIFWIAIGVLWLVKPEMLRTRMGRKAGRRIKWPFYGFVIFLGINFLGMAIRVDHMAIKIAGVIGVFMLLQFIVRLQSQAMTRFFDWWSSLPLNLFRAIASLSLITGITLLLK